MTSEQNELEKIKKEKEINKKNMQKNKKLYLKSFNYSPMKIKLAAAFVTISVWVPVIYL